MTADLVLFVAAGAALLFAATAAIHATFTQKAWPGPWLHTCPTSELLNVVADCTRDKALASALRDRAAHFAAHND